MAKIRAKYMVKGPKMEEVTYTKCSIDPETKSLEQKQVTEKMECFYVFFPQGHSIRVTSREKLKELGYDKKPRLVDMETGDVIDRGGDPYDFSEEIADDVVLMDENEIATKPKGKTTKEPA